MALVHAQRFCQDMASDKSLNDKVKQAAAGLASLVALAKTHGYDFTLEELKQAIRGRAKRELSDTQLETLAGGGIAVTAVSTTGPASQTATIQELVQDSSLVTIATTIESSAILQASVVVGP